jgi:hypothetical protein
MPERTPWYDRPAFLLPIVFAAVAAILFHTCAAYGQTVVTFKVLPSGHDGKVQGVGQIRYYLLDEYLTLAKLDAEFVKQQSDVNDLVLQNDQLKRIVDAKDTIIVALQADKKILGDRSLRLEENLHTCEKALVECYDTPIWPYVVGAVGASVGLVGIGMWLGSR